jgi:hypothetical protein
LDVQAIDGIDLGCPGGVTAGDSRTAVHVVGVAETAVGAGAERRRERRARIGTAGRGQFSMEFSHYSSVPRSVLEKVKEEVKAREAAKK